MPAVVQHPVDEIIEAVARLQGALSRAGLEEPLALIVRGEEQKRRLELLFESHLKGLLRYPNKRPSWEGTTIRGLKIIHDMPT